MQSSIPDQLAAHWFFGLRALQKLLRGLEARFIHAARVTACSAGLDAVVRARFPDAAVEVWRYPATQPIVPPDTTQRLRRALDIPDSARVVYYGGNFAEYQGLDTLLAAIPRVLAAEPDTVFLLVGSVEADRLNGRLPVGRSGAACRVVPRVAVSEVPQYLSLADVTVSPRSSGQNLPLKIIDYMASGKPIVATDRPAHREVLDDDVAVLVQSTPEALGNGIVSLLKDRERAARLGAAARRRAELEFGLAAFESQVCRILGRIESREGPARTVPEGLSL
jgi:glycosyltransferase involved in cell wall biosynthesis